MTQRNTTRLAKYGGAPAVDQVADCFDYANQGGDRLRAIDYIPDLAGYNFNNRIDSCCFTGIWILYVSALPCVLPPPIVQCRLVSMKRNKGRRFAWSKTGMLPTGWIRDAQEGP